MVATSVAVIRSRNESMWERREAATCVRREKERKEEGRKEGGGEKERREEGEKERKEEGRKKGRRRERKKGGRKGKEEERQRNDRMQYSGKFSPVAGQTIVHLLLSNYQSSFSIYE